MSRRLLARGLLVFGLSVFGCGGDPAGEERRRDVPRLDEGQSLSFELEDGETRTFTYELAAGELLRLRAEQHGVDVEQRVTRAGQVVARVDSVSGLHGPETLLFESDVSGSYRVHVQAIGGRGEVRLDVEELGPGSDASRSLLAARRLLDRLETDRQDLETKAFEGIRRAFQDLKDERKMRVPRIELARLWWRLGRLLKGAGRLDEASEAFERAREDFADDEDGGWELATVLNDLSDSLLVSGRLAGADSVLGEALSQAEQIGHWRALSVAWSNRGVWHAFRGEPASAVAAYTRARDLALELDGAGAIVTTVEHNIAVNELHLGRFEAGLEMLRTVEDRLGVVDASQPGPADAEALALVLSVQAWALDHLDRDAEAVALYERSVELLRPSGGHSLAVLLEQRADFYLAVGRPRDAIADLEASRAAASPDPVHDAYLDLRFGEAYAATGRLERAEAALERARVAFGQLNVRHGRLASHLELARVLRRQNRPARARRQLEAAVELIEMLRADLELPALRRSFLDAKHEVYGELVDLLAGGGEDAAAFEVAEAGRARSLLDALDGPGSAGGELLSSLRMLTAQRLEALQDGDITTAEKLAGEIRRRRRELERREQARLAASESRRAAPSPRSLTEIQSALGDDTVLLSFVLGEERSWLFRVDASTIRAIERPPRVEIERSAESAHELLKQGLRGETALAQDALARLAEQLLANVDLGAGRLAVVADGALHLVPFGVLPEYGGRMLLASHEMIVLPSASVLVSLQEEIARREPAAELLAVIADPVYSLSDERFEAGTRSLDPAWRFRRLPASAEEARRLADLTRGHEPFVRLGFEARAELVLENSLADYRWLHFAGHAFLDPRFPEQSGLVLSLVDENGQALDGLLQREDLSRLDLGAELVVLSACDSALGRRMRGEGLVGLAQAFFTGGAGRLVASLWDVKDNELTVSLMETFYRRLLAGRPPAAALRDAQLEQQRRGVPAGQWAAFVFIGPWDPLAPLSPLPARRQ